MKKLARLLMIGLIILMSSFTLVACSINLGGMGGGLSNKSANYEVEMTK